MRMIKKRISRIILCIMLLAMLPLQVFAIDRIDLTQPVNLTVHFTHEGQPLPGAQLQIYKVAEISEWGEFTFLDEYAAYPVLLPSDTDWAAVANTLDAYIREDGLQPTDTGVTDQSGTVTFPRVRKPMEPGLYLLTGKTLTYNDVCYTPAPTLIALPNREGDSHHWDYDVEATMKYTFRTAPVDYTVMKVWEDDGAEGKRPASVKINLLKDGQLVEAVVLSAENNWQHTWPELERGYDWTVTEEVPDGYTVVITGSQCVYENSRSVAASGQGASDTSDTVSSGYTVFTVTNTYVKSEEKLPQTGRLWWPVPVLVIAGVVFVLIGLMKMRRLGNER